MARRKYRGSTGAGRVHSAPPQNGEGSPQPARRGRPPKGVPAGSANTNGACGRARRHPLVGLWLQFFRARLSLTQEAAAKAAGTTGPTRSQYETGRIRLHGLLPRLHSVLDLSDLEYLLLSHLADGSVPSADDVVAYLVECQMGEYPPLRMPPEWHPDRG